MFADGKVVIDQESCIGCGICATKCKLACYLLEKFPILYYNWGTVVRSGAKWWKSGANLLKTTKKVSE